MITVHTTHNELIHKMNHPLTRPRPICSRLAVKKNHTESKDGEIASITNINAINMSTDMLKYMLIEDMQEIEDIQETTKDAHIQQIKEYIIRGWPSSRNKVTQDIQTYWTFKDDLAMIDGW